MDDLSKSVESLIDCVFDLMQHDRITVTSLEYFVDNEHFGSLLPFDETVETILCLVVQYLNEQEALDLAGIFLDFCLDFNTEDLEVGNLI